MVLELKDEPFNVRNITLDKPETAQSTIFDVAKIVTPDDWEKMLDFKADTDRGFWLDTFTYGTNIGFLNPEKAKKLLRKEQLTGMMQYYGVSQSSFFLEAGLGLKVLYPEEFGKEKLSDKDWMILQKGVETPSAEDYFEKAAKFKILYPDRATGLFFLPTSEKQLGKHVAEMKNIKNVWKYTEGLLQQRILFPQDFQGIDPEMYKEALSSLEAMRSANSWRSFVLMAMRLKLLTAQEIIISPEKIEIIDGQKITEGNKQTPLPEQKKF